MPKKLQVVQSYLFMEVFSDVLKTMEICETILAQAVMEGV
jgi:hypothetical protein